MKRTIPVLFFILLTACYSGPGSITGKAPANLDITVYNAAVNESQKTFLSTMSNLEKFVDEAETENKQALRQKSPSAFDLQAHYDNAGRMIDAMLETAEELKPLNAKADAAGNFIIPNLQPGDYHLIAASRGPDTLLYWSENITVKPGRATHADLNAGTATRTIHKTAPGAN